jgi:hypothetical protein
MIKHSSKQKTKRIAWEGKAEKTDMDMIKESLDG